MNKNDTVDGGGLRANEGKARMDLVAPGINFALAQVMGYGAKKYAEHNWRRGMKWSTVYACAQRHLLKFWMGEEVDEESQLDHLYHVAANIMMLIEYRKTCPELDDRFKGEQLTSEDFNTNLIKCNND